MIKAMSHEAISFATCNAMALHCKFQARNIALQVAEKVEAASTFRNATRQVAACDILTATCNIFFSAKIALQVARTNSLV